MTYSGSLVELRFNDDYANSHKFYRIYTIADEEKRDYRTLFNWGRIGSKGQFKVTLHRSEREMQLHADEQQRIKELKGYERHAIIDKTRWGPELLSHAGVNDATPTPVAEDPMTVAAVKIDMERALRLATGPPADQAVAVSVAKDIHQRLSALREVVTSLEGQVEMVDMMIMTGMR
jgi:predicted DNA-binding WGR domain protein